MSEWIFGYGSLVADALGPDRYNDSPWEWTALLDHRRAWNVSMDNTHTESDRKYYIDTATGERPDLAVTFLNVYQAPGDRTNGVAVLLGEDHIRILDKREQNYERVDVSNLVSVSNSRPVWTYMASKSGRERYQAGLAAGNACVSKDYFEYCMKGFDLGGEDQLSAFNSSTDSLEVPLRDLRLTQAS